MQMGPDIELSMRAKMLETQSVASKQTLRSAAATRQAKPGMVSSLRLFAESLLQPASALLGGGEERPAVGECSTVVYTG